jgi:mRNA interferase MazF
MKRGGVVLVRIPHASGIRGKKRPAVIVQSDAYVGLRTLLVAEVTTNLSMANDPACLLIESSSPEGIAIGIAQDSVITCLILYTIYANSVFHVLGSLSQPSVQKLDDCLKAAMALK